MERFYVHLFTVSELLYDRLYIDTLHNKLEIRDKKNLNKEKPRLYLERISERLCKSQNIQFKKKF